MEWNENEKKTTTTKATFWINSMILSISIARATNGTEWVSERERENEKSFFYRKFQCEWNRNQAKYRIWLLLYQNPFKCVSCVNSMHTYVVVKIEFLPQTFAKYFFNKNQIKIKIKFCMLKLIRSLSLRIIHTQQ